MRLPVMILASAFATSGLLAADRVTLAGKILDTAGQPIDHATVLVYHAGVKKGYSTFCPSCYADCGKRASTGLDGTFVIKSVDSDLLFELLAVRGGFQPAFIKAVDPLNQSALTAILVARPAATSPEKVVRGRVVDDYGLPLRDSVVQPVGISTNEYPDGTPSKSEVSLYGTIKGLEPIAVTDEKGEFEIANQKPALGMLLKFETRGFAPKLQALPTGMDRKTVMISQGAVVRGRLVDHGTPVAGAEIGLIPRNRGGFGGNLKVVGDPYEEIRVGTQADGSFVLADVPTPIGWYVYPKMASASKAVAAQPLECDTKHSGEILNVGDIQLKHGHRLRGKLVLRGGASIPDGMRVIISANRAWDSQVVPLHPDGSFECSGLPTGSYDISPAVRGYRPAEELRNVPIDHDIDKLTIVLEPQPRP